MVQLKGGTVANLREVAAAPVQIECQTLWCCPRLAVCRRKCTQHTGSAPQCVQLKGGTAANLREVAAALLQLEAALRRIAMDPQWDPSGDRGTLPPSRGPSRESSADPDAGETRSQLGA